MNRITPFAAILLLGSLLQAADGSPVARAALQAKTGATVASAQADANGCVRFTNVPPGEYRCVVTSAEGRSVTITDPDCAIVIEGRPAPAGFAAADPFADASGKTAATGGGGSGKVNVQDISMTKRSAFSTVPAGGVVAPRDSATGMATGKRMHKPYCALVDWDGSIKGGFASERHAQTEGEQLPPNTSGRCALRVVCDEQPGTIEISSWSWGASNSGKYTKTGHVTLMK
jgi:hypothetical protein